MNTEHVHDQAAQFIPVDDQLPRPWTGMSYAAYTTRRLKELANSLHYALS